MKSLMVLLVVALAACSHGFERTEKTILDVTGNSKLFVPPNRIEFRLEVSSRSPVKDSCITSVKKQVKGILEEISSSGVRTESLSTAGFYLYCCREGKQKTLVYRGSQSINFSIAMEAREVDKIVNKVKNFSGADISMDYEINQRTRDSVGAMLGAMALKDAAEKARFLARNSGLKIHRIAAITYNTQYTGQGGGGGVEYEQYDANGSSFSLVAKPFELNDYVSVSYVADDL